MPPVLSTLQNANIEMRRCRKCRKETVPGTPTYWDSGRRMCVPCARANPLTIVLPRQKHCSLCKVLYPVTSFEAPNGQLPYTRCLRCRHREKCTRCSHIYRRKHFRKPSRPTSDNSPDAFFKTCDKCRKSAIELRLRKHDRARAEGAYFASWFSDSIFTQYSLFRKALLPTVRQGCQ